MPELDPTNTDPAGSQRTTEDDSDEEMAAAYEALDEDRRRDEERALAQHASGAPAINNPTPRSESPDETGDSAESAPIDGGAALEQPEESEAQPETTEISESSADQPTASSESAASPAGTPARRVFVIDNKEYPDPDPRLPITGTRSVQAMYRDYFPGQLDNVDVVQKPRPDGTLEVTFKRRIGTKGTRLGSSRRRTSTSTGEVAISVEGVVGTLKTLSPDRPLAWDLVEQAMDARGRVRLDFVPPAAQLNLAEAQQSARARLIEQSVGQLRSLRPSL
jgi:hypothetical protein